MQSAPRAAYQASAPIVYNVSAITKRTQALFFSLPLNFPQLGDNLKSFSFCVNWIYHLNCNFIDFSSLYSSLAAIVAISKSSSHKHCKWTTFIPSDNASPDDGSGSPATIFGATERIRGSTGCTLYDAWPGRQPVHDNDAGSSCLLWRSAMGLPDHADPAARNPTATATDSIARRWKPAICEYIIEFLLFFLPPPPSYCN